MKKILICLSFIIFFTACVFDITENRWIKVTNHSENKISALVSKKDINNLSKDQYADEAIRIDADSTGLLNIVRPTWERYIEKCDGKKIRFYIIKTDSIEKYGWDVIKEKNIYNKKYLFTIEDLEKLNWEVIFDDSK